MNMNMELKSGKGTFVVQLQIVYECCRNGYINFDIERGLRTFTAFESSIFIHQTQM
jgi:hypothetical protein